MRLGWRLLRLADVQRLWLLRELAVVSSQRLPSRITFRPPLATNGANSGRAEVGAPWGALTPRLAFATEAEAASETSTAVALVISAGTRYAQTWLESAAKPVLVGRYRIE